MSIARGWGINGQQQRWEDYIKESSASAWKSIRARRRKEKIKKILDGNKHS